MQVIHESDRRGPRWTRGAAVRLADGSTWFLPRLDLPLLATQPELGEDLRQLLWAEGELGRLDPDSIARGCLTATRFDLYRIVAGRLLRLNYDRADDEWDEALPPGLGEWLVDLARHVGDALVEAITTDWRPLAFPVLADDEVAVLCN